MCCIKITIYTNCRLRKETQAETSIYKCLLNFQYFWTLTIQPIYLFIYLFINSLLHSFIYLECHYQLIKCAPNGNNVRHFCPFFKSSLSSVFHVIYWRGETRESAFAALLIRTEWTDFVGLLLVESLTEHVISHTVMGEEMMLHPHSSYLIDHAQYLTLLFDNICPCDKFWVFMFYWNEPQTPGHLFFMSYYYSTSHQTQLLVMDPHRWIKKKNQCKFYDVMAWMNQHTFTVFLFVCLFVLNDISIECQT